VIYKGLDTMGHDQGQAGYWEQDPSVASKVGGLTQSIAIDPTKKAFGGTDLQPPRRFGQRSQQTQQNCGGADYRERGVRRKKNSRNAKPAITAQKPPRPAMEAI
jgi:hypothetical protein